MRLSHAPTLQAAFKSTRIGYLWRPYGVTHIPALAVYRSVRQHRLVLQVAHAGLECAKIIGVSEFVFGVYDVGVYGVHDLFLS